MFFLWVGVLYMMYDVCCHKSMPLIYKVIPHAGPLLAALLKTQVHEWEKQGKPDPCGEHLVHFVKVLKTSHDEAQSEFKRSEEAAS